MQEAIIEYGNETINELLAIIPSIHLILTILISFICIKIFKPKKDGHEALIVLSSAFILGLIAITTSPDKFRSTEGIISLLVSCIIVMSIVLFRSVLFKNWVDKIRKK